MQITGKATISVDGKELPTENGAKLTVAGVKRNVERHGGRTYYHEEEVAAELDCNILHTKDVDVVALSNMVGVTGLFKADTGQVFILRGGFTTEPVPIDASSGKSALKMAFQSVDKK